DWKINEDLICEDINIKRYKTLPPCRFTEATLISAMKHITPFIKNGEILQRLHSTEGIGTSVTRAHMIDTLFKRGYLIKGNKSIFSSGVGRDLIRALPEEAKSVDMTALWEQELYRIEKLPARDADEAAKNLIIEVENCTRNFISEAQQKKNIEMHSPDEVLNIKREKKHYCPRCHSVLVLRNGRYGSFWGCSAYPGCEYTSRWID